MKTFESNEVLENYVLTPDYIENQICFSMNWNAFDTSTKTYDLQLRYIALTMIPSTIQNQAVVGGKFNQDYGYMFYGDGFISIMSMVTAMIAKNQFNTDMEFEMMYTSMNSDEFVNNTAVVATMLFIVPIFLIFYQLAAKSISEISQEEHEAKIEIMLKKGGMREIV